MSVPVLPSVRQTCSAASSAVLNLGLATRHPGSWFLHKMTFQPQLTAAPCVAPTDSSRLAEFVKFRTDHENPDAHPENS